MPNINTINFGELLFIVLTWGVWVILGYYVAKQKRRSPLEGALLGILGPFGILIECLLPTKTDGIGSKPID